MKRSKQALFRSVVALLLCFSMFVGTTFAWFSDSETSTGNIIQTGRLKVQLHWTEDLAPASGEPDWKDASEGAIFNHEHWEPGYTDLKYLKITNAGNLAFQYQLNVLPAEAADGDAPDADTAVSEVGKLAEVIDVYYGTITEKLATREEAMSGLTKVGTLASLMGKGVAQGILLPENGSGRVQLPAGAQASTGETTACIMLKMQETAGNEYMGVSAGDGFRVQLQAVQYTYEQDAFGNDYDTEAMLPELIHSVGGSAAVDVADGKTTAAVTIGDEQGGATIPAGVQVADGVTELTLSISEKAESEANVTLSDNEAALSLDVHIDGVAEGNTVPMIVSLGKVLPVGMNMGNVALYHVEDNATNQMTQVSTLEELDAHNEFYYDVATGNVTVAMATFSEVAVVADTENAWNGNIKTDWYGDGFASSFNIYNADQLAGLGELVSGGNDFSGKTIKLIADINMGGSDYTVDGKLQFYPIGYTSEGYKGAFSGTFDGEGHKISNIYQNTWMLAGNYDNGYYNAAMGLFGYVYGGTVKNLTVDNFDSEGEFAPTGCVAAYAADATFENIAITRSHPQTYNTSVAAVVGRDGSNGLNSNEGYNLIFRNITVDSTNTVSALWGSWDVGAAGLLGYLGSDSKVLLDNCNVSATIDVYNDVCGNYQYYWYRYCGMLIGTVDKTDSTGALDLSNITAKSCTVDFGTRHEYYYCEFFENSKASYTHDYQFSRVSNDDIVGSGDSATCQNHDHDGQGYETIDGKEVLVEDKQAVYIPFRQIFGGYGWGVKGTELGENLADNIKDITQETEPDAADQVKFVSKFTGDFLYRVGTQNAINVGTLFSEKDGAAINSSGVYVTITSQHDDNIIMGTFTAPTADKNGDGETNWLDGQIKFDTTGVAKVTIQDYDYCTPTVLYLEVVNAKNITSATSSTNGTDIVLLSDVTIAADGAVHYTNCTVYGNGFTYDVRGGMNKYNSAQGHGIIIANGSTLDNLVVLGDVYDTYGAYTSQEDYTGAIDATNTIIQNCHISHCATPVRANSITIKNTTLNGGTVANLIISGGTNTLEDVTTVNYNDEDRNIVGLGIVISDGASDNTKVILDGKLTQHNYVSASDVSEVPGDAAQAVFNSMFTDAFKKYRTDDGKINTGIIIMTESLNTDIITDNANTGYTSLDDANITLTVSGLSKTVNGAVYAPASTSGDNNYDADNDETEQGDYLPVFTFNLGEQVLAKDNDDDTRYLIGDENGVEAMYPEGEDALSLDLTKLATVTKYTNVSYPVTAKCVGPDGKEQTGTVTLDTKGTYTLVFTVNDNVFYDEDGNAIEKSVTRIYEVSLNLDLYEKSIADATMTISSNGLTGEWGGYSGNWTYTMYPLDAISEIKDDANKDGVLEAFSHNANIKSVALSPDSNNAFSTATTVTVTYNDGQVLTLVLGVPSDCSSPGSSNGGKTLSAEIDTTHGIKIVSDGKIANKCDGTWPITSWSFKGTSQKTVTDSTAVTITFSSSSSSGSDGGECVTPDTLITLADGTQKEIQYVTYEDQLLVWDFYNGSYTSVPAALIVNHGLDNWTVITLTFDDGTVVKAVTAHAFFDADTNEMVLLNAENAESYVGHSFVKADGDGYSTVTLTDVSVDTEYTESYTLVSVAHYNFIVENLFSLTNAMHGLLAGLEVGENMMYDEKSLQADIEQYGLYTYADFADYITYEQFVAFNGSYLKISVEKGTVTFEEILNLIQTYLNN